MDKKTLHEIAKRAEEGEPDQFWTFCREDIPDLLAYIEELEKALAPLAYAPRSVEHSYGSTIEPHRVTKHAVKFAQSVLDH